MQIEAPREVQVNREQFDALVAAHQRAKGGIVERGPLDVRVQEIRRRARFDVLAFEHERRKMLANYAERHAGPMTLPSAGWLHASQITAQKIYAGSMHSGRSTRYARHQVLRVAKMEPTMIIERSDTNSDHHTMRGSTFAIVTCAWLAAVVCAAALLPLWAIATATVVLGIAVYLGVLTADVCRTTIPASEIEQKKIDWIVNAELPDLPDRYTCLDCGRFPEDCVCDEKTGKPKPRTWTAPCEAAMQTMDDPSNDCILCGFPVQDH